MKILLISILLLTSITSALSQEQWDHKFVCNQIEQALLAVKENKDVKRQKLSLELALRDGWGYASQRTEYAMYKLGQTEQQVTEIDNKKRDSIWAYLAKKDTSKLVQDLSLCGFTKSKRKSNTIFSKIDSETLLVHIRIKAATNRKNSISVGFIFIFNDSGTLINKIEWMEWGLNKHDSQQKLNAIAGKRLPMKSNH